MKKTFAQRTDWPQETNALVKAYQQLKAEGAPLLDLTVSNPTLCSIKRPKDYLNGLSREACGLYEPASRGHESARQAVSDYYASIGFAVSKDQIILTSSTSEAYTYLFRLLANYGDQVLFPQPSYPLFAFLGDLNDIVLERYRLDHARQWQIDVDHLKGQINERTRAIVCLNPNNPTGSYIGSQELDALNAIAQERHVPLICDEVFWDFKIDEKVRPVSLVENKNALSFTMNGLSKLLGLPQMKLSWIVVSGPSDLQEEAIRRLEFIADTYLSVNTPVQSALAGWLAKRGEFQQPIIKRVRENFALLKKALDRSSSCSAMGVQGGWYAMVRFKGARSEEAWALKLLNKYHVFVHPGYFFDVEDEGYLIISLLCEPDIFEEGVSRLVSRIEQEAH